MQDIEAEDKILGPFTLRQFIFGLITAFLIYICVLVVAKHVPFLLAVFIPPAILTGFFAFPFGRDQPTEVWALAKLRFWFKPRKRLWDQSGVKELVTINVPKKIERTFTDGLSQTEVRSRLKALANTIDSRGWAIKNVNVNAYTPATMQIADSDRLLGPSSVPQEVPETHVLASDDILDERNNPIAQQFDTLISQSSRDHREQLMRQLQGSGQPTSDPPAQVSNDPWFMGGSPSASADNPTADDAALLSQSHTRSQVQQHAAYGNLRTLQPVAAQPAVPPAVPEPPATPVTPVPDPAILSLANNNDLNVATIAREAEKAAHHKSGDDEVVISLR